MSKLHNYYTKNINLIDHYISDAIAVDIGEEGRRVTAQNEEAIRHQRMIDSRLAKVTSTDTVVLWKLDNDWN